MSRSRRHLALTGVLVLLAGLAHALRAPDARPVALRIAPVAVQLAPVARQITPPSPSPSSGVLPPSPSSAAAPMLSGRIGVATAPVSLRYTFDAGVHRPITDLSGGHELWPLGQNGGVLRLVPQGMGLAVAYPDRCTMLRESDCPRAILQGLRDDSLNPGTRPLQYGASVLMTHGDLSDGANVVQKGYSVGGGSQFKLQVDHRLGHPSCVITGRTGRIYRAEPWMDVADARWHNLVCARADNRLTLYVDGVPRAWVRVPPRLAIANAEPLRVGGKGPAQGNDQYAGEIDNVFLTIGS
ncbi:LamG-like jellyroll fold domain-containing protein [Paractinoplanes globisporus]|uniref:LamG-like jellyroll fold domain-containing protein n=1 Tax=Paractinoplanes globisporus TaxID=113565 RepID=A0ABW6WRC4_9ACTN|nr:LamG-like jellyroll fold domain-containing protein [Actinoplanes globisporus]